jgi:exopolyphosphatase/pppGpp-phosphohydrolase
MTRVAAIDCGTNSIRLLIADIGRSNGTHHRLTDVVREMRVVRLGQGVDATGELAPEALERTFAATADYAAAHPRAPSGQGALRGHLGQPRRPEPPGLRGRHPALWAWSPR